MNSRLRVLLAILSGILVSVSFPVYLVGWKLPEMGWLAWLALVPLFVAVRYSSPRGAYFLTMVASSIWYLSSFFWIVHAMYVFGGMSLWISILLMLLLVLMESAIISFAPMIAVAITKSWRGEIIIWMPVMWTTMELCRNYFPFGGFPWSNIAMSQWRLIPLIQIVDIVGIYGLIFLMVWINLFISECIVRLRGGHINFLVQKAAVTLMAAILTIVYGIWRVDCVNKSVRDAPVIQIGMIQGNIPQDKKWDEKIEITNLDSYRREAAKLGRTPIDLIVWPEASFPWYLKTGVRKINPKYLGLQDGIVGTTPFTFFGAVTEDPGERYHNSALLLDSSGKVEDIYHKVHMVPFGEYVPYQKLFFFIERIALPSGNFYPGELNRVLTAGNMKFVPLICYEDVFPEISRKSVKEGADFLLNITNNAWFGETSAPYQQLALSVFRAVENRRYLIRSTNTGVSAVIGPTGKILVESGLFVKATIVSSIRKLSAMSVYTKLGDWFAYGCAIYASFGVIMLLIQKTRRGNRFRNLLRTR